MLKQLLCLQRHEGCQSSRSAENKAVKTYGEVDNMETDQRASDGEKASKQYCNQWKKDGPGAMGSLVVSLHKVKYSYDG